MTKFIFNFILNDKNQEKNSYIWNMIAALSNSLQSMLLMLVITRHGNVEEASYVAIGFAYANLMMTIGKFGMRNFQVTDINEKYSFNCYKNSRYLTIIFMIISCIGYLFINIIFNEYSIYKNIIVILFCIYKIIEAIEDVYHGRLQQFGRLDIASKIWSVRNIIFILEFTILYVIFKNLMVVLIISIIATFIVSIFLNSIPKKIIYITNKKTEKENVKDLIIICFPIAVATFLLMYISNAPKYIIDSVVTDKEQTCFNILFMSIYVVTLLSNFIYNPVINKLAVLWEKNKAKELLKIIYTMIFIVAGIILIGVIFAEIIGRKMLGYIYNVSLENYRAELILMLISGGLISIMNLLYMIVILLRKQKIFYILFSVATLILICFGKITLNKFKLLGMCWLYIFVLLTVNIILFICTIYSINKKMKSGDSSYDKF